MRMHPERSLFIFGARVSIAAIDVIPSSLNAFAGKASVMSLVTVKITNSISFSVIALLIRISIFDVFQISRMTRLTSKLFETSHSLANPIKLFFLICFTVSNADSS